MLNQKQISEISGLVSKNLSSIFGNKLLGIVLFGSYARNDFSKESDIDYFIILDLTRDEIRKYRKKVSKLSSDIGLEYNLFVSTSLQSKSEFDFYKNDLPFFQNVLKDGVDINVS
ncbi:MAG: nucleotidyltransferase domain-containing protein [Bacillota bacterium]